MKNTSTANIHHHRRFAAIGLVAALTLVAACGKDDPDESGNTAETTETTLTTETTTPSDSTPDSTSPGDSGSIDLTEAGSTGEPIPPDQEADVFVHPDHPTCAFRIGELNVRFDGDDQLDEIVGLIGAVEDVGPIAPESSAAGDIHLLRIGIGPLAAASTLTTAGFEASPNYIFAFAPGWRYAPFDTPKGAQPTSPPQSDIAATIAVLDTGFADLSQGGASAADVQPSPSPPPPGALTGGAVQDEVTTGLAAGHGTFIVNQLGQLLPNATYFPTGISPRYTADDGYVPPSGGTPVSIRDDSTVTSALTTSVDPTVEYLNVSFGSYGCTALKEPPEGVAPENEADYWADFDPEGMDPWLTPLGFGVALDQYGSSGVEVFAASGNDGNGTSGIPATAEIFYPAGWALNHSWLHSVASDPKTSGINPLGDYSNRGVWVETQARGSRVVSQLPNTDWGDEGWFEWSGTSFAAPCALAQHVIDPMTADQGHAVDGPYLDCAMNLTG